MKKIYHKLVRDKIPAIIQAEKKKPVIRILKKKEYQKSLLQKLIEEAEELVTASPQKKEMIKEIGDVLEVVDALIATYALDKKAIIQLQKVRRKSRGGFEERIFLEYVED